MAPGTSALLITEWSLIALSTLVIAARIYLRLIIQKRRLLDSDVWMTSAWAMAIIVASFCITYMHMGVMEPDIDMSLKNYNGSTEDKHFILKLLWISSFPFYTTFYLCKAALLGVYHQVIPPFMYKRRMFLRVITVYVILAYITTILLLFCVCTPISSNWTLDPDKACPASSGMLIFKVAWAVHFSSDVFIFVIPWLIVPDLNLQGYLKVGVYMTFLLGLINIAVSIIRFVKLYIEGQDGTTPMAVTHFWNSLDLYIGLVIACLPSLRPYFNLAAESRAFNYVKGKTTGRTSRYTTAAGSRGSKAAKLSNQASGSVTTSAKQPSLYDGDTEAQDESLGKGDVKDQVIEVELARVRTRANEAEYQ